MTSSTRTPVWAIAVALIATGCASTGTTKPDVAPDGAVVEVINRSDTEMWVSVRGRVEATAVPRSRVIIRHLVRGLARVRVGATPEARASKSTRDVELTFDQELELLGGKRNVIDFYRPGAAAPLPLPLGDLKISNALSRDVDVWVDQVPMGKVLAGSSRLIRDVVSGVRSLRAADRKLKTVFTQELAIRPQAVETWKLAAPEAELRIINDTIEAVWVTADDRDLGRVAPGTRLSVKDLGVGKHLLIAIGEATKHRYQKVIDLKPDFPAVWGLASGSATLILVNLTGEDLTAVPSGNLVPSSARTLSIPAGSQYRVDNVVAALIAINAVTSKTNTLYKMQAELRPGQVYRWEIRPASSGVRVVNRTSEILTLYASKTRLGELRPDASLVLNELSRGAVTLQAFTRYKQRFSVTLPPAPREPTTWTIRPITGALRVYNQRPEILTVYVDALRVGDLGPKSEITFTGIPTGSRLVEAVGLSSKTTLKSTVSVAANTSTTLRFKDPRALLTVVNKTGERLMAKGLLASQTPVLNKEGRSHFNLPAGTHQLVLIGRTSGLAYRKRAELVAESKVHWVVDKPTGFLSVRNSLEETVAVSVNGIHKGTVSKGHQMLLGPLPAMLYRLVAEGVKSKRMFAVERRVPPDGRLYWNLVDKPARMLVDNRSQEHIQVLINGRPYGLVANNSRKIFGNLITGTRKIEVVGVKSRVVQNFTVPLGAGRTDVLVVHAPFGTVMIDNLSGEDVIVRLGNKRVGKIRAGRTPTPVPIPAGLRLLQVEHLTSGHVSTYRLHVRSLRSLHLQILPVSARVAIKNTTAKRLTIFASDRQLGVVPPGKSLLIDDLAAGTFRFKAVDSTGKTTHKERRKLTEGELFAWELR